MQPQLFVPFSWSRKISKNYMKEKKMGKKPPQKAKQMGCETADRENVFIKQRVLWVTVLLWVQHCSHWHRQEFWQQSAWGPDQALPFTPIDAVWTLFSPLVLFYLRHSRTFSFSFVRSPQVCLHNPLRWRKTVPHFSHGGCHLEARRLLLLTGALGILRSRPADTREGTCHLQAVGNVLLFLPMVTAACLFLGLPQHQGKSSLWDIQAT